MPLASSPAPFLPRAFPVPLAGASGPGVVWGGTPTNRRLAQALAALGCVLAMAPREAHAQGAAAAEALFKKGLADFNAKKFDTGCPALEESFRVDPRAGSLFTSADCYAAAGKVTTASSLYEQFERFVDRMPPGQRGAQAERLKVAADQRAALKPRIPSLTLSLAAGSPEGTVVKRDGLVVGKPALGVALPVDPGEHVLVVYVEGGPTKEQKIVVKEGEKKVVELAVESGAKAMPPPAAGKEGTPPPAVGAPPAPAAPTSSSRKTIGFVVAGVGAAVLVGGGVAGVLSMSKKKTVDDECRGSACSQAGKDAADSGKTLATISTIGVAVGVVGVAAGVYLIVSAPKAETAASSRFIAPTATPLPGGGLLGAVGRFLPAASIRPSRRCLLSLRRGWRRLGSLGLPAARLAPAPIVERAWGCRPGRSG